MSIIRAIKHRLGLSVTPANNFVLTAEADNGTMKLARESGQDIMTVDAAGKVAFPQGFIVPIIAGTVGAENGTPAAGSAWDATIVRIGNLVHAAISIYIEGPGTATGGIILSGFPVSLAGRQQNGIGREANTGVLLQGLINPTSSLLAIYRFDNTVNWAQGIRQFTITYIAAQGA